MVRPVISVSSLAGWLGRGRKKVVCKRASVAVERTASAILMTERDIFRTRRVRDGHRGARSRPVLLHTKGGESKGSDEVLRGEKDSVGAIAIIRRVDNEGNFFAPRC